MRSHVFAAGLFAAALCVSAGASAADLKAFTADNVKAALTGMGVANVTSEKDASGTTAVKFAVNEAPFVGLLVGCKDQQGCLGLLLVIPVGLTEGKFSHQAVNGFNEVLPFGKAVRGDDGAVVFLSRYVIADGGVSDANLRANIAVFTAMPASFAKYLSTQVVASVAEPGRAVPVHLEKVDAPVHGELQKHYEMLLKQPRYTLPQ